MTEKEIILLKELSIHSKGNIKDNVQKLLLSLQFSHSRRNKLKIIMTITAPFVFLIHLRNLRLRMHILL